MGSQSGDGEGDGADRRTSWSDLGFTPPGEVAEVDHPTKSGKYLRGVPEPTTADRRAPVARWVMTLSEPLLSVEVRSECEVAMARFIGSNDRWACHWFAGFIFDVVSTLPPNDPWRHLSATVDLALLSVGERGRGDTLLRFDNPRGAEAPAETGAVLPSGARFGTAEDSSDVLVSDFGAPDADIGLVALAEPLDDLSSAIAGFATSNVEAFGATLAKIYHHLWLASDFAGETEKTSGERFLQAVGPVLRRFIHRRRIYTGSDDPFPSVAGFAWMARADRLMDGNRNISSELGLARSASIDPGAYDDLKFES